jgi:DNA-binding transcriptional LysR family regulator
MTLKQLEAFYWAATCASFALAAERLHLSTSSLSKRIAELESSLAVPLFHRGAHKAVLSEAGQALVPRARALLRHAGATRDAVGKRQALSGRCSLGLGELSALTWLPRLIPQLRQSIPHVALEPQVDIGQLLEERLRNGSLDCAVIAGHSAHEELASHLVGEARFVWVTTPASLAGGAQLDSRMLARQPLVTLPRGAGTTQILDDWLLRSGCEIGQRFTCNSWGAIAGLLIEGFGIGILPVGWARTFAARRQLHILPSSVELAPLAYTFRHRRQDDRRLIAAMLGAVQAAIDFDASPCLL